MLCTLPDALLAYTFDYLDIPDRISTCTLSKTLNKVVTEMNIPRMCDALRIVASWWNHSIPSSTCISALVEELERTLCGRTYSNTSSLYCRVNRLFYIDTDILLSWNRFLLGTEDEVFGHISESALLDRMYAVEAYIVTNYGHDEQEGYDFTCFENGDNRNNLQRITEIRETIFEDDSIDDIFGVPEKVWMC